MTTSGTGAVVLSADFRSEDLPGWALGEGVSMRVEGGELQARWIPDEAVSFLIESDESFEDIDAQVVMQWDLPAVPDKAPAWSGIAVRASDDGYYVAAISTSGLYSIYWYTDDDSGALVDDTEHPAITTTQNTLRVVASGTELSFYVNGTLLTTVEDDGDAPFTEGSVALVLITTEQPAAARFRKLELREVS